MVKAGMNMNAEKHNKGLITLDIYIAGIIIIASVGLLIVIQLIFTNKSVEDLKFAEETSNVDTYLYVLLNNNYCTPNTKLPLKDVIATALSQSPIPSVYDNIRIEYGNKEDILQIGKCIGVYADRLYIGEYYFYVEYGGTNYLTVGQEPDDESMSTEEEHIAVPKDNKIATVVLRIKKDSKIDPKKSNCPADDDLRCVQKKTCQLFGGICKSNYLCGINQCCCKDLPI